MGSDYRLYRFTERKSGYFHIGENSMTNILIVGAGVVGQATGKGFAKKGHQITYVDIDRTKLNQLQQQGMRATSIDAVDWAAVDIVMLTVSTPTVNKQIVLDYIKQAAYDIGNNLVNTSKYVCIVVRSTVPPTTTESVIRPILERTSGKLCGVDFGLAMNPEFLRQRTSELDFDRPWITVLGILDQMTMQVLYDLYMPFGGLVVHCTPTEAEMIKYVNNVYNAVKISYFNEVHQICETIGVDSSVVSAIVARSAESMWNPIYGTRGGAPYGGACLPKDTEAFMSFCNDHGITHKMLEATIAVNEDLLASRPAAQSPEEIDQVLNLVKQPTQEMIFSTNGHGLHNGKSNGHSSHLIQAEIPS
ncbi:MAG: nucleotide sugar dehydrogenase [Caldilineaceae bacterium]